MRALVTGGAGFLASHVADALTEKGHDVTVFDKIESPYIRANQQMLVGDILDDKAIRDAVKENEVIYHFAAIADIGEAIQNPTLTVQVNIMGTLNILEAIKNHDIKRFVFASSIYVYSNQGSFYRTSKQTCERLIEDYNEQYNLPFTILRFGSLYGPRSDDSNAVHGMIKSAMEKSEVIYEGTGEELREYIHVKDGALAAVDVLNDEFKNEIIHLTGHEKMTTRQMMEMISEIIGGNIQISVNAGEMMGHYMQTPYSYTPKLGRKLIRNTYIDIGLGLLDLIEHNENLD